MAAPQNFRSAFNGFNREDVVNYISFTSTRHETELNDLHAEMDNLNQELEDLRTEADTLRQQAAGRENLERENALQKNRIAELERRIQKQSREHADLLQQLSQAKQSAVPQQAAPAQQESSPNMEELNAYRRAESVERRARERVGRMFDQANGILAETAQNLEASALSVETLTEQVRKDLEALQFAIGESGQAVADAAQSLRTVRPEEESEE